MNTGLAVVALASSVVLVAALGRAHLVPTGLSPVRCPVSAYALTRGRAAYAVAAFGAAVAAAALALLLWRTLPDAGVAAILLATFAVTRALIPFFPMDPAGAPRTRSGRLHTTLAVTAFATVTAAAFVAAGPLMAAGQARMASISTAAGVLMACASVVVILSPASAKLRRIFGVAERCLYLGFIGWFCAFAITYLVA